MKDEKKLARLLGRRGGEMAGGGRILTRYESTE